MTFTGRWKGYTKGEVSERMAALALRKNKKMTRAQRVAHAHMMVTKRGGSPAV